MTERLHPSSCEQIRQLVLLHGADAVMAEARKAQRAIDRRAKRLQESGQPVVRVAYRCRDIGYGVEEGEVSGVWGATDNIGKRSLHPIDGRPTLYLFRDEILSEARV